MTTLDPLAQRRLRFLLGFLAYFVVIWVLWDETLIYPLKIFVVFLHEVSHGFAAVATGGGIQRIEITPDQGGVCFCGGGSTFLTLSAGYLGSLLWGIAMLMLARAPSRWHFYGLFALGLLVLGATILFVRSGFGIVFGLLFGFALIGAAKYLPMGLQTIVLTVLGLTSCLYAILDIKSDILDRPEIRSDARMLAELTGIPTVLWGLLWIALALAVSWWLLGRLYKTA